MRKKGNTVLAGLIICLLLVFLAAAGKLFGAYLKYQKGDVSYEKLQEYVQEPEEEESPESEKEKEEPKNRYLVYWIINNCYIKLKMLQLR